MMGLLATRPPYDGTKGPYNTLQYNDLGNKRGTILISSSDHRQSSTPSLGTPQESVALIHKYIYHIKKDTGTVDIHDGDTLIFGMVPNIFLTNYDNHPVNEELSVFQNNLRLPLPVYAVHVTWIPIYVCHSQLSEKFRTQPEFVSNVISTASRAGLYVSGIYNKNITTHVMVATPDTTAKVVQGLCENKYIINTDYMKAMEKWAHGSNAPSTPLPDIRQYFALPATDKPEDYIRDSIMQLNAAGPLGTGTTFHTETEKDSLNTSTSETTAAVPRTGGGTSVHYPTHDYKTAADRRISDMWTGADLTPDPQRISFVFSDLTLLFDNGSALPAILRDKPGLTMFTLQNEQKIDISSEVQVALHERKGTYQHKVRNHKVPGIIIVQSAPKAGKTLHPVLELAKSSYNFIVITETQVVHAILAKRKMEIVAKEYMEARKISLPTDRHNTGAEGNSSSSSTVVDHHQGPQPASHTTVGDIDRTTNKTMIHDNKTKESLSMVPVSLNPHAGSSSLHPGMMSLVSDPIMDIVGMEHKEDEDDLPSTTKTTSTKPPPTDVSMNHGTQKETGKISSSSRSSHLSSSSGKEEIPTQTSSQTSNGTTNRPSMPRTMPDEWLNARPVVHPRRSTSSSQSRKQNSASSTREVELEEEESENTLSKTKPEGTDEYTESQSLTNASVMDESLRLPLDTTDTQETAVSLIPQGPQPIEIGDGWLDFAPVKRNRKRKYSKMDDDDTDGVPEGDIRFHIKYDLPIQDSSSGSVFSSSSSSASALPNSTSVKVTLSSTPSEPAYKDVLEIGSRPVTEYYSSSTLLDRGGSEDERSTNPALYSATPIPPGLERYYFGNVATGNTSTNGKLFRKVPSVIYVHLATRQEEISLPSTEHTLDRSIVHKSSIAPSSHPKLSQRRSTTGSSSSSTTLNPVTVSYTSHGTHPPNGGGYPSSQYDYESVGIADSDPQLKKDLTNRYTTEEQREKEDDYLMELAGSEYGGGGRTTGGKNIKDTGNSVLEAVHRAHIRTQAQQNAIAAAVSASEMENMHRPTYQRDVSASVARRRDTASNTGMYPYASSSSSSSVLPTLPPPPPPLSMLPPPPPPPPALNPPHSFPSVPGITGVTSMLPPPAKPRGTSVARRR